MGLFGKRKPAHPNDPARVGTSAPGEGVGPELSAIDTAATRWRNGDAAAQTEYWQGVFSLAQWHLVARGEMPDVRPFVGQHEQGPMLAAFTSPERATEFARRQDLAMPDGSFGLLSMGVEGAIACAGRLERHGVLAVVFDDGVGSGAFALVSNLAGMYEHARGKFLADTVISAGQGEFDHRRRVLMGSQEEPQRDRARAMLHIRLFHLPGWFFVASGDDAGVLTIENEEDRIIPVYTDPWSMPRGEGAPATVSVRTPRAVELIAHEAQTSSKPLKVIFNAQGEAFQLLGDQVNEIWGHLSGIAERHAAYWV